MKGVKKYYIPVMFLLLCSLVFEQAVIAQTVLSPQDKRVISRFEKQVNEYTKLRERHAKRLPKLPKDATADQLENYKVSFQKSVQTARSAAKQGEIFTPEAAQLLRRLIKNEFNGKDRAGLREKVFEAQTQGVPVKVNFPYPDSKEQVEMPPTLLLTLPQLPKHLRYRFVGQNLLLVDRENSLIVDYMINALP